MAKSRSSTRDNTTHIASRNTPKSPYNLTWVDPAALEDINYDRRRWRPDESTRPPSFKNNAVRVVDTIIKIKNIPRRLHGKRNRFNPFYQARSAIRTRLGFSVSRRLEMCIRRSARKEVMHAKKHAGKAGQRRPSRNFWSAISCR